MGNGGIHEVPPSGEETLAAVAAWRKESQFSSAMLPMRGCPGPMSYTLSGFSEIFFFSKADEVGKKSGWHFGEKIRGREEMSFIVCMYDT